MDRAGAPCQATPGSGPWDVTGVTLQGSDVEDPPRDRARIWSLGMAHPNLLALREPLIPHAGP
jgi:hypothetical protein